LYGSCRRPPRRYNHRKKTGHVRQKHEEGKHLTLLVYARPAAPSQSDGQAIPPEGTCTVKRKRRRPLTGHSSPAVGRAVPRLDTATRLAYPLWVRRLATCCWEHRRTE
jgi:hypothetical protein